MSTCTRSPHWRARPLSSVATWSTSYLCRWHWSAWLFVLGFAWWPSGVVGRCPSPRSHQAREHGATQMNTFVLMCGNVFDGVSDTLTGPAEILVEENRITKIE